MVTTASPRSPELLARATRVSTASAVWTLATSVVSIAIGVASGSLALAAFGAVGVFDCASDVVLIVHFSRERRGLRADHIERAAVQVVAVGLVVVGLRTGYLSLDTLTDPREIDQSTIGLVVAVVSFAALSVLAFAKRRIAAQLGSHGLRADAQLTIVGAVLGAITVAGMAATAVFGWWWSDPVAALAIAVGALGLSIATFRSAGGDHTSPA